MFLHSLTAETVDLVILGNDEHEVESHLGINYETLRSKNIPSLIVVVPNQWVSYLKAEMPQQADSKARLAIPFCLEEQVASDIKELHFAFDKAFYREGHYEVAIVDKSLMVGVLELFAENELNAEAITGSLYSLKDNQALVFDKQVLIKGDEFNGVMDESLFNSISTQLPFDMQYLISKDTEDDLLTKLQHQNTTILSTNYPETIAMGLAKNPCINFSQGEFQSKSQQSQLTSLWKVASGLGIFFIILLFSSQFLQYRQLTSINDQLNADIAAIYKEFFPKSTQVVSPKFRIQEKLKQGQQQSSGAFLQIAEKTANVIAKTPTLNIHQVDFRNQSLKLTLNVDNFATLEKLKRQLKRQRLKVIQNNATSIDQGVKANLELKL